MGEKKTRIDTFRVDMICDQCREGKMLPTGITINATDPIQYEHVCVSCGDRLFFKETYPNYRQEEVHA